MIHIDYDPQRFDPYNLLIVPDAELDAETIALLDELDVPIEDLDVWAFADELPDDES